jgi:MFS family permease
VCVAVGFTINVAFYGAVFVYSLFFQQVLGLSALGAGLLFLPMTALVSSANLGSARAAARFGPRLPIWAGQLVAALGTLGLVTVGATTDRYLIAVILIPVGIGLGFAVPSLTAMLLEALPSAQAGLAAGVLNSGRQVGGTVAVAVFGALVAHRTSFGAGVRDSMLIVAVMLVGSTLAALRLPRLPFYASGLLRRVRRTRLAWAAAKVRSSAFLVAGRSCWASVMNRQSTTVNCAIRLVMAPDRKAVSRAAVSRTKSATSVIGDHGKFVTATVVAP